MRDPLPKTKKRTRRYTPGKAKKKPPHSMHEDHPKMADVISSIIRDRKHSSLK